MEASFYQLYLKFWLTFYFPMEQTRDDDNSQEDDWIFPGDDKYREHRWKIVDVLAPEM